MVKKVTLEELGVDLNRRVAKIKEDEKFIAGKMEELTEREKRVAYREEKAGERELRIFKRRLDG